MHYELCIISVRIQLQHRHKRLLRHLNGAERAHLLLAMAFVNEKDDGTTFLSKPKFAEFYQEFESYDYILIDTAGHSHKNETQKANMNDFIHYKNLDEEFSHFREHAHEDTETELPFPYLVL